MNNKERIIVENHIKKIKEIIKEKEGDNILKKSGSVFYSGYATILEPNGVYLLGINPGGDPDTSPSIEESFCSFLNENPFFNAYRDQNDWGNTNFQKNINDLFIRLHLGLRETCASNLVFERTPNSDKINSKKIKSYINIHDYIINDMLNPSIIITIGKKTYNGLAENWLDRKQHDMPLNISNAKPAKGTPRYLESKDGNKLLCYIPHVSWDVHYKKFADYEFVVEKMRSKIHDVLKKRNTSNLPIWKFTKSYQSLKK